MTADIDSAMYLLVSKKLEHISDLCPDDHELRAQLKKLSARTKKLSEGLTPSLTDIFDMEDRIEDLEKRVSELTEDNKRLKDRLQQHEGPTPISFDMKLYEANRERYQSLRDLGKFEDKKGQYGLFLTDGRNLVFELESSAIHHQQKAKDQSSFICMLHGENAECIGPL